MLDSESRFKPGKKPSASAAVAAGVAVLLGISFFASKIAYVIAFLAVGVVTFKAVFVEREPPTAKGRELAVLNGVLRQYDSGRTVAEIDVTKPFEYRVLDRYDVSEARFRLYQRETELTFYVSDPGGADTVREVIQITWPPRNRNAGRSYPPSAV